MKLIIKVLLFIPLTSCATVPQPVPPMTQCAQLCELQDVRSYHDRNVTCDCNLGKRK